jgi:hypothetical protein
VGCLEAPGRAATAPSFALAGFLGALVGAVPGIRARFLGADHHAEAVEIEGLSRRGDGNVADTLLSPLASDAKRRLGGLDRGSDYTATSPRLLTRDLVAQFRLLLASDLRARPPLISRVLHAQHDRHARLKSRVRMVCDVTTPGCPKWPGAAGSQR